MPEDFDGVGQYRTRRLIDQPWGSYLGLTGDRGSTHAEITRPMRASPAAEQDPASTLRSEGLLVAAESGPEETSD